jgi:hypothetical protein
MTSYNTSGYDASAEIATGYNAVIFGTYRISNGSVSVRDYDDTPLREANVYETIGITRALDDIYTGTLTEYSAETRRMLDLAAGLADSSIDLDGSEWDAWADSVCTCRPDSVMACPACLDAIEARYGDEVPF